MRILRGLSSRFLSCGCLVGVYETYDGQVVSILDARAAACVEPQHQNGNLLPDMPRDGAAAQAADGSARR
jgi:hypothetical protein